MANEIVLIDKRLDQLLTESPTVAIQLIAQEYQISVNEPAKILVYVENAVQLLGLSRLGGGQEKHE